MRNINTYILEKLKIDKSVSIKHLLNENDKMLMVVLRVTPDESYIKINIGIYQNLEEKNGKLNISYKTSYSSTVFNVETRLNDNNFYEVEKHEKDDLYGLFLPIEDGIKFIEDICLEPSRGTSYIINNIKELYKYFDPKDKGFINKLSDIRIKQVEKDILKIYNELKSK